MNEPQVPYPDHRKIIPIWIEEEQEMRKTPGKPRPWPTGAKRVAKVEKRLRQAAADALDSELVAEIEQEMQLLIQESVEKAATERRKQPTQYEREQAIMGFRRLLPPSSALISPNMMENREDVFEPQIRGHHKGSRSHTRPGCPVLSHLSTRDNEWSDESLSH